MKFADCELDAQQIEAVVACEDAQLVLAAAGSGKTLSLLAKISYLHHVLKIPPEQILAISFTKKTVDELRERCDVCGVDFQTFHALGNRLLKNSNDQDLGSKTLLSDEEGRNNARAKILTLCEQNKAFAREFNDYVLFYHAVSQNPDVNSFAARVNFNRLTMGGFL